MGETKDDAAPPAVSEGDGAESVPTIPKPRFDQVNGKLQEAQQRIRELESKLGQQTPPAAPAVPASAAPAKEPARDATARELQAMKIQLKHQISEEAANLVISYQEKGLSADEALDFARSRQPALFGEDRRGFDAATHATRPPGTGSSKAPEPPKEPTELEKVRAIKDPTARGKAAIQGAVNVVKAQMFGGRGAKI